jgi:uncharacterized membrane protein YqjE
MSATAAGSDTAAPADAELAQKPPGLFDEIKALWNDARGLVHDHVELAVLETKLAGESIAIIIGAGVAIAVLLVSAWLGLLAFLVLLLILAGIWASVALLIAVALNLAIAGGLYLVIRRKSRQIGWKATLANLHPGGGKADRQP